MAQTNTEKIFFDFCDALHNLTLQNRTEEEINKINTLIVFLSIQFRAKIDVFNKLSEEKVKAFGYYIATDIFYILQDPSINFDLEQIQRNILTFFEK